VGQVALRFGADDFGSVMFEENVVSSAGTTYGTNAEGMETRIKGAGFRSVRRNVRYDWLTDPR
jgi:cyclic dehypoxanthinyl futalosine synthase